VPSLLYAVSENSRSHEKTRTHRQATTNGLRLDTPRRQARLVSESEDGRISARTAACRDKLTSGNEHSQEVKLISKNSLRRRDSGCPEPPPQTRTCSFPASGSSVVLAHQASARFYANTSSYCKQRDSVMRGLAIPSFSMARPKAAQVKLLRLPPRRFSHLNAETTAAL